MYLSADIEQNEVVPERQRCLIEPEMAETAL
jgi:hypothetical protein